MTKEIELALQNIDAVCSSAMLNRNQHAELARNIQLIHSKLMEVEQNKKAKKDGDSHV